MIIDAPPAAGSEHSVDVDPCWTLGVRFAGFARAVAEQRDRLLAVARDLDLRSEPLEDAACAAFWQRQQEARERPASFRAKLAMLPADPGTAALIARLGRVLHAPRAVLFPTLGLAFVAGDDDGTAAGAEAIAGAVTATRRDLAVSGGSLVLHEAPPTVRARVDVWGVAEGPRSALPLMRAVKARLDPDRRLAPGRFVGAI